MEEGEGVEREEEAEARHHRENIAGSDRK